jgi:hypothetical protein
MYLRGKPVGLGEVKAGLIDVDGNDARCTIRFGQRTGKKANCTYAEDEHALARFEVCPS